MEAYPQLPVQDHHGSTLNFEHLQRQIEELQAVKQRPAKQVQIIGGQTTILAYGLINAAGEVQYGSENFVTELKGVAEYQVKWNVAKGSAKYVVTASAVNGAFAAICQVQEIKTTLFKVVVNTTAGVQKAAEVSFIALSAT